MSNHLLLPNVHPNFTKNHIAFDELHQYVRLSAEHVDQIVEMFTEAFCRSEPMTHYLHMDEKLYRDFARAVTEKAAQDRLSVVALENKQVVACAIVEDIAAPGPIPDFDPKFKYILGLLEQLGEKFFAGKTIPQGSIAHLFITAVHENHRHKHLSKQVNFHAMDLALAGGFDFMYCEFTHFFNEKGTIPYLDNPKQLIGAITYKDFVMDGEKPFADLSGQAVSYLWELIPNAAMEFVNQKNQAELFKLS
jgi:hypothetical protein